jgi:hypothetical protein
VTGVVNFSVIEVVKFSVDEHSFGTRATLAAVPTLGELIGGMGRNVVEELSPFRHHPYS